METGWRRGRCRGTPQRDPVVKAALGKPQPPSLGLGHWRSSGLRVSTTVCGPLVASSLDSVIENLACKFLLFCVLPQVSTVDCSREDDENLWENDKPGLHFKTTLR